MMTRNEEMIVSFWVNPLTQQTVIVPLGEINDDFIEVGEDEYAEYQKSITFKYWVYLKDGVLKTSTEPRPSEQHVFDLMSETWVL